MLFHGNAIIDRANKLAEIAANTLLIGPYLLLFPQREKSGALVQSQTFLFFHINIITNPNK